VYILPLVIPRLKIIKGVSNKGADISNSCIKHIFKRAPFLRHSDFFKHPALIIGVYRTVLIFPLDLQLKPIAGLFTEGSSKQFVITICFISSPTFFHLQIQ